MNLKAEFFAFIITNENCAELASEFDPKDVMPATNENPTTFEPGYIAVIRLISADDPFEDSLGNRLYSVWITTHKQFDDKFVVDGVHEFYTKRIQIHPK